MVSWGIAKKRRAPTADLGDHDRGLRLGFEEHFRDAGSISLFVGLACNLAFVGSGVLLAVYVAHYGVYVLLYRCLLCRRAPLRAYAWFRLRQSPALSSWAIRCFSAAPCSLQATWCWPAAVWGGIHVPEPVNWVCGAIFGVYLPVAMTSWFAVHIDRRSFSVIWNIELAGVFASFVIWVFSGLEAVKLCVCMGVLMFVGTFVLSRKLRSEQAKEEDDAAVPAAVPADAFRYPASATFLFSFSFITAISHPAPVSGAVFLCFGDFFIRDAYLCRGSLGKCIFLP